MSEDDATVHALETELSWLQDRSEFLEYRRTRAEALQELAVVKGRQREVLVMSAKGMTAKEIGAVIGLSYQAVDHHKCRLREATGLTLTEAAVLAAKAGWV